MKYEIIMMREHKNIFTILSEIHTISIRFVPLDKVHTRHYSTHSAIYKKAKDENNDWTKRENEMYYTQGKRQICAVHEHKKIKTRKVCGLSWKY